jgi:hypothetical protein
MSCESSHFAFQYGRFDLTSNFVYSTQLEAEKRLALQEEKQALEAKLLEVPKMKARLAELKVLGRSLSSASLSRLARSSVSDTSSFGMTSSIG